ncbi:NUDIX hydrolase domain-like protein [Mycena metata]|uniref:NUDIX hydrolase domain-like protein n=1 Tax=Mycena metata TaxID=1033252 RepID=A0AAD7JWR9_9AGAR|nr:NUDIX hydrolase domain-like protein [Mycena metata]
MLRRAQVPGALAHRDIPLDALKAQHPGKRITVGVAIVSDDEPRKLLLLQRSANEDTLPNMFELPGGNCDPGDLTVIDAVARETEEETGLVVAEVLSEFEHFEYSTKRGPAMQLNFLVRVEHDGTLKLNPEEHQACLWIESPGVLDTLPMTAGMKKVVACALEAAKENN